MKSSFMRLLFLVASSFDGPFEGAVAMPSRAAKDLASRTTHSIYLSLSPQNVLPNGTASAEEEEKGEAPNTCNRLMPLLSDLMRTNNN